MVDKEKKEPIIIQPHSISTTIQAMFRARQKSKEVMKLDDGQKEEESSSNKQK